MTYIAECIMHHLSSTYSTVLFTHLTVIFILLFAVWLNGCFVVIVWYIHLIYSCNQSTKSFNHLCVISLLKHFIHCYIDTFHCYIHAVVYCEMNRCLVVIVWYIHLVYSFIQSDRSFIHRRQIAHLFIYTVTFT